MTESFRDLICEGRTVLPSTGDVCARLTGNLSWVVVDAERSEIEPISAFLLDLSLSDVSPLTLRSYGYDLLRWWRLLSLVDVEWDHASRADVELLVGWMRHAPNPQRQHGPDACPRPDRSICEPASRRCGRVMPRRRSITRLRWCRRSTPSTDSSVVDRC